MKSVSCEPLDLIWRLESNLLIPWWQFSDLILRYARVIEVCGLFICLGSCCSGTDVAVHRAFSDYPVMHG